MVVVMVLVHVFVHVFFDRNDYVRKVVAVEDSKVPTATGDLMVQRKQNCIQESGFLVPSSKSCIAKSHIYPFVRKKPYFINSFEL